MPTDHRATPTELTVYDYGGQVIDIRARGAACDGTTDDYNAVQDVLAAAGQYDAVRFWGPCRVTQELIIPTSGITLLGLGWTTRVFNDTDIDANVFTLAAGVNDVLFQGFCIQAKGREWLADTGRDEGNCINMASTAASRSERVRLHKMKLLNGHWGALLRYCDFWEIEGCHIETAFESWGGACLWSCNNGSFKGNRLYSTDSTGACTAVETASGENGDNPADWNDFSGNLIRGNWRLEGLNICSGHNTGSNNDIDIKGSCIQVFTDANANRAVGSFNTFTGGNYRSNGTLRVTGVKDSSPGNYGANDNRFLGGSIAQLGSGNGVEALAHCLRNAWEKMTITLPGTGTADAVVFNSTSAADNALRSSRVSGAGRYGFLSNTAPGSIVDDCDFFDNENGVSFAVCAGVTYTNNRSRDNITSSVVFASCTGRITQHGNESTNEPAPSIGGTIVTLPVNDTTPSVRNVRVCKSGNTSATTVSFFDDGIPGQEVLYLINDNNTTIDFTGTNLRGRATDWTPASGEAMSMWFDGSLWHCTIHKGSVYADSLTTWTAVQTFQGASGTAGVFNTNVTGDGVNSRLLVLASGSMNWGSGGGATDTQLGRAVANVLAMGTDDCFRTGLNTTANRPTASAVQNGSQFFDTTLQKPIWSDGTNWRDATGTVV